MNEKLILAGSACANICYNLAQDTRIDPRHRESMRQSYQAWDEALNEYGERRRARESAIAKSGKDGGV